MKIENFKSVLLISHELSMTGAPVALQYMARQLKKDGIFVTVLSPVDGPLRKEFQKDDLTVIVDSSITGSREWLKWAVGFDLIVVNTVVIFHVINQLSGEKVPVLWWIHDGEMSFQLGADRDLPYEIGANIKVVGVGDYTKKVIDKYRPSYRAGSLLYCIPDFEKDGGVDYFIDTREKKNVFLSVGSIDKRKAQDILVKVIRDLSEEVLKESFFVFIGRKGDEDIYGEVCRLQEEYPEHVMHITEVTRDEMKSVYRQVSAVICTSRDDPMPVFMTESMILSKPVICSENTGTYSLIKNLEDGMVYHDENDLAKAIEYCALHWEQMEEMGKKGRQIYIKHFTEDAFRRNLYKTIKEI